MTTRPSPAGPLRLRTLTGHGAWVCAIVALCGPARAQPAPAAPPPSAPPADGAEDAAPATPVTIVLDDGQVFAVVDGERKPLGIEGPVVAIHQRDGRLYVARGSRGVAIYDVTQPLAPVLEERIPLVGSNVTGFSEMEGQVWVVATSRTAVPLTQLPASETSATPPPSGARSPTPTATPRSPERLDTDREAAFEETLQRVELRPVSPGQVELVSGADDGVRVGDTFLIVRATSVEGTSAGGQFIGEERVALAEVVAVSPTHALAQVGRSARVEPSDYARRVTRVEAREHRLPPLEPNVGEVSLVLRPLIKVGTPLGGGLLADLGATYWGRAYFLGLSLQPLGLGLTGDGNVVSTAASPRAATRRRASRWGSDWVRPGSTAIWTTCSTPSGPNRPTTSPDRAR